METDQLRDEFDLAINRVLPPVLEKLRKDIRSDLQKELSAAILDSWDLSGRFSGRGGVRGDSQARESSYRSGSKQRPSGSAVGDGEEPLEVISLSEDTIPGMVQSNDPREIAAETARSWVRLSASSLPKVNERSRLSLIGKESQQQGWAMQKKTSSEDPRLSSITPIVPSEASDLNTSANDGSGSRLDLGSPSKNLIVAPTGRLPRRASVTHAAASAAAAAAAPLGNIVKGVVGDRVPVMVREVQGVQALTDDEELWTGPTLLSQAPEDCRGRIRYWVESNLFDFVSGLLIIANAVSIGMQTADMARNNLLIASDGYHIVEVVFCALFSIELLVRVYAYGGMLFDIRTTPGRWAVFDLLVVGFQLGELMLDSLITLQNTSFMRLLRILRLVRVLRVVRIIRLLGELRTIVASIMNSMRALFWTLVLLFLGIYIIGIYFTQLVLDWKITKVDPLTEDEEPLIKYFGELSRSILSLYQAMSGGVDWDSLCNPLIEYISPMQGFVFALYIAFTVLALMNVVTGVFVEGSLRRAKQEEQKDIINQLRGFFRDFDEDESGRLSVTEFQRLLAEKKVKSYLMEIDVELEEAHSLFNMMDADRSGQIDYNEFVCGCMRLRSTARAFDVMMVSHELRQVLRLQHEQVRLCKVGFRRLDGLLKQGQTACQPAIQASP
mmetsp:Transcript_53120/g.116307  ORF Transcript_53120/g.116307 Transcript_53120/m.116307 type:complete len:668 (-) Transcript_53120:68-2071(-)